MKSKIIKFLAITALIFTASNTSMAYACGCGKKGEECKCHESDKGCDCKDESKASLENSKDDSRASLGKIESEEKLGSTETKSAFSRHGRNAVTRNKVLRSDKQ